MNDKKLRDILNKHLRWINGGDVGERANLCGANLYEANLYEDNLFGASLRGANLCGANLYGANLCGADLYGANLHGAIMNRANLSGADLYGANLHGANLAGANLSGTDLSGANLYGANLDGANLREANLGGASLRGATIGTELLNEFAPICCPEYGSFTAWKKAAGRYIVRLKVTESAKRSSAYGRKCRCSEAEVLAIENIDGTIADVKEVCSMYDGSFVYKVGDTVRVDNFNEDRRIECTSGIHFFITRAEAVDYRY